MAWSSTLPRGDAAVHLAAGVGVEVEARAGFNVASAYERATTD